VGIVVSQEPRKSLVGPTHPGKRKGGERGEVRPRNKKPKGGGSGGEGQRKNELKETPGQKKKGVKERVLRNFFEKDGTRGTVGGTVVGTGGGEQPGGS